MANSLFHTKRFEDEMNDELQHHIELQTKANIEKGMDPDEARRRANLEFGGYENVREQARETRALAWVASIWRDVKIAVRGLLHEPWFTLVCVFVLMLAIGANTTVFSIINATFLRNLPYNEPDRIMEIWEVSGSGNRMSVNYLNFKDSQHRQDSFSDMSMSIGQGATIRNNMKTSSLHGIYVTGDFFSLLDVKPAFGRDFTKKDDAPGAPNVAILTAGTWSNQFGANPDIVGKFVQVDDRMVEIIGILPDNFTYPESGDIFMPLAPIAESLFITSRNNRYGSIVLGRLAPRVDVATARTQLKSIATTLAQTYPENEGLSVNLEPLQESMGHSAHERVIFLYGAVGLFLLIACVNLSNMFLARGMTRTREMAIRAALGATRGQLIRQLLIESMVLSAVGGIGGLVTAWQLSSFVGRLIPWEIRNTLEGGSAFDLRVCLFAILLTFATGILFGLAPALRLSCTKPSGALKETGGAPGRRGRLSGSDILIMVQVSLVVMLLVSAGLLTRSLQQVIDTPSGIDPESLITFQISGPSTNNFRQDPNSYARFYLDAIRRVEELPGVESAAFSSSMPYSGNMSEMSIYRIDQPTPQHAKVPSCHEHLASPGIFKTLGIPLLKGRLFGENDPIYKYPENTEIGADFLKTAFNNYVIDCVVNKRMAEMFWPGEDPIGKRLHIGPPEIMLGTAEVVGVVGNTIVDGAERGELPEFYLSFRSLPSPNHFFFAVRSRGDPSIMMRNIKQMFDDLYPNNPADNIHLMKERMSWFIADRKFTVQLLSAFALAALVLAAAGIYGVLSFVTARRTREIAIRLTLGAQRGEVLKEVLRRGVFLLTAGLVIGLVASFFAQRFIRSQLFGVNGTDSVTYLFGGFVLLVVGLVACFIPAWRASRVDPMSTLRTN